jgi:hypothetical protein
MSREERRRREKGCGEGEAFGDQQPEHCCGYVKRVHSVEVVGKIV